MCNRHDTSHPPELQKVPFGADMNGYTCHYLYTRAFFWSIQVNRSLEQGIICRIYLGLLVSFRNISGKILSFKSLCFLNFSIENFHHVKPKPLSMFQNPFLLMILMVLIQSLHLCSTPSDLLLDLCYCNFWDCGSFKTTPIASKWTEISA